MIRVGGYRLSLMISHPLDVSQLLRDVPVGVSLCYMSP